MCEGSWCTLWQSWLRHCAKNLKVAGSIPNDIIGIFHSHSPFYCTMILGSSELLTEMRNRNNSWGA